MGRRCLPDSATAYGLLLLLLTYNRPTSCESITNGELSTETNQCVCTFNVPPVVVCTEYDAEHRSNINSVELVLANLTSQVEDYKDKLKRSENRIMELDSKLSTLTSLMTDNDKLDQSNVEEIRKQLLELEDLLDTVRYNSPNGNILQGVEYQIQNITSTISKLAMGEADWKTQAANVQAELNECRELPSDPQRMLKVSQWPSKGAQDTCEKLSMVLQPFTVRDFPEESSPRLWFSDPLKDPQGVWFGTYEARVCTVPTSYNCGYGAYEETRSTLQRYNETKLFQNSLQNYQTYYLPHHITQRTVVAYNGSLFYVSYDNRRLVKFDVQLNATKRYSILPLDIGIEATYAYTEGGLSSIDLEVDESGLWMIYSITGNDGLVVLSKVDTTDLSFTQTWYGNFPKRSLGNCFVACGVLYCVSSHDSHNAKVNYYYDTNVDKEGIMNVAFDCKYGDLKSLKYNPYDQKLYAVDNGHAVVYGLIF